MEAIITFNEKILLEYNISTDQFEISEDGGDSYPYEFYEEMELCGRAFYLIYLEDLDMIPTSTYDRWLSLDDAIIFLEQKQHSSKDMINVLKDLKIKDIL